MTHDIDHIFVSYRIKEASNDSLKDDFKVQYSYEKANEEVSLKIDLTKTDPNLADSSVLGELSIENTAREKVTYEIGFRLISNK